MIVWIHVRRIRPDVGVVLRVHPHQFARPEGKALEPGKREKMSDRWKVLLTFAFLQWWDCYLAHTFVWFFSGVWFEMSKSWREMMRLLPGPHNRMWKPTSFSEPSVFLRKFTQWWLNTLIITNINIIINNYYYYYHCQHWQSWLSTFWWALKFTFTWAFK